MNPHALDLFAGAGGTDLGALDAGYDPLGIEVAVDACATRAAAGLRTGQTDVRELDPLSFAGTELFLASPPCPSFSNANAGRDTEDVKRVIAAIRSGRPADPYDFGDARSVLTVEPRRWLELLHPRAVVMEQVPAIKPVWEAYAEFLQAEGYATWVGILECERYGVPQTRERAILLARLDGKVGPPHPTHQRYVPGLPAEYEQTLFGEGLLPWVSMAEALGWGMTERPSTTVMGASHHAARPGGAHPLDGGSRTRELIARERERGAWEVRDTGDTRGGRQKYGRARGSDEPSSTITSRADQMERVERVGFPRAADGRDEGTEDGKRARDFRSVDEPAQTVTEKARSWELRAGNQDHATVRRADEPAPTIAFGHAAAANEWQLNTGRDWKPEGGREAAQTRDADEPAPTVTGGGRMPWQWELKGEDWPERRPSTTVAAESGGRVFQPGSHHANDGRVTNEDDDGRSKNAIRVEPWEAGVLQSFPPNYPWQGNRTEQFRQIGNAFPPLAAAACIRAVTE